MASALSRERPSCELTQQYKASALPWPELGVAGLAPAPGPVTAASLLQLQLWGVPAGEGVAPPATVTA